MGETGASRDSWPSHSSEVGVGVGEVLPTGTVTLLLADVEGSTRLWEAEPDAMTAAVALLDRVLEEAVATHHGVRPVEQGEGDSFVIAFARASDAVACALTLQLAPLAPLRLRIGLHTGEVQLRDEGNYIGPTPNRTARLRNLAHGGQAVLSGATSDLVVDRLPAGAWLEDLGRHRLRDLARAERVAQLCHPELRNDFPPLRGLDASAHNLPVQLTTFVGRVEEMVELRRVLADHRLVTLTGAGGAGKTRLALQLAADGSGEFADGVWQVDLAPVTDPDVVPVAVMHALGLPDEPGRPPIGTIVRFVADQDVLVVLDNCEHLLDASAALVVELLHRCPSLTLVTTSREPLGVAGEVTWRVPSLALATDAIELFADRARRCRPDFEVNEENADAVSEICRRLDGIPLAIELAAARVRALSPVEIVASLHDRFRLLTGGSRIAVRRQQTLRASVDWSHALLTEPERSLFRRLAAFMGGFDLDAARVVCAGEGLERYHVLDQLSSLVDKSLVVADEADHRTRYRLLETVRQYALEKLGESGEADDVRIRHRDHYTSMATTLDAPVTGEHERRIEWAETDIDNLRAAFEWSRERGDLELALQLAASLLPLWLGRGRIREGVSWFDIAFREQQSRQAMLTPEARARTSAANAVLLAYTGMPHGFEQAEEAVDIARRLGDDALLARALASCGCIAVWREDLGRPYFDEAIGLARETGQMWTVTQILGFQAFGAILSDDPIGARHAGEEGLALATKIGDEFVSRQCRTWIASARMLQGDLTGALKQLRELEAEAVAARDAVWTLLSLHSQSRILSHQGRSSDAQAAAREAADLAADFGEIGESAIHFVLGLAALVAGDLETTRAEIARSFQSAPPRPGMGLVVLAEADLVVGDVAAARMRVDEAIASTTGTGYTATWALVVSARIAFAAGEHERAERDAHDALACSAGHTYLGVADALEFVAELAAAADSGTEAARLLGAAAALRHRTGEVRGALRQPAYEMLTAGLRAATADDTFERAWEEGEALTADDAISYAQRGRGARKRPTKGWASLTPSELDVVRLIGEGLPNKEIAARLFVSPRTVQSHLTHVYTKLDVTSRVQLAQEAARRTHTGSQVRESISFREESRRSSGA